MAIFFTSDQHYDHANVIKYCNRPFADPSEMNEEMIRRHNAIVKQEDTVYHLGDFSLNKRAPGEKLHRLNGEHHLIAGNHDACHTVNAKNQEKMERYRKIYFDAGFKTIKMEDSIILADQEVRLCHLPYYDPNPDFDQRYASLRPIDEGSVLLHGHVHQHWQTKLSAKGTLMINVGVDVWGFAPVSVEELESIINKNK